MTKLLFTLFILSVLSACQDHQPDPIYNYLSEDVKAYLDFKPGSYWIYKDSITGKLDSSYVFAYNNEMYDCTHFRCGISFKKHPVVYCENVSYWQTLSRINLQVRLLADEEIEKMTYQNEKNNEEMLYYNNIKLDTTDTIKGNGYSIFRRWQLKKNVGLIKFELPDSSVHELVDFHIVQ